jgi:ABC-type antimicrobial peptide transport system permease subunit
VSPAASAQVTRQVERRRRAEAAGSAGHGLGAPVGRGEVTVDREGRRAQRQAQRRAERELARQEAAAVLAGTLLPGEEPPRRGRRRGTRPLPAPVVPAADASQAMWAQTREGLLAAAHSLANNRLRSLLTAVGIIAGVASVIVLVALGDGMKQQFKEQTDKVANQINISSSKGGSAGVSASRNLTDQDVKALQDRQRAPDIAEVSEAMTGTVALTADQAKDKASLLGVQENFARLTDRKLIAGRWFTPAQIAGGDRSVILGPEAVNLLYGPGIDPNTLVGRTIRLSHSTFKIQGVFETNGQADNSAAVPFNAARAYLTGNDNGKVDQVIVKSTSVDTVDAAVAQAVDILDQQHRVHDAANRDYNITTYTDSLRKSKDFINYLTWFIVAIAAISLFVGGVGVANIMLVSVTERTREIGIRKAVGAKTTAILRQFLSEAVMLTGIGGLVGIILGIALTEAAIILLPRLGVGGPDSEVPIPVMSAGPVLIAFIVSLLIGILAGGYPANRAARLRPIEALRFE